MSSAGTGLFYAYAININDDWSYRYLITFANRDVADSWFRAVTDSVTGGYNRFSSVKRVSLQFYTHNPSVGNIPDTINDARAAQKFRGEVFFTLLNDRDGRIQSLAPVLNYTDHVSGGRQVLPFFYIRSVPQPDTFWYFDFAANAITASRDRRTKFIITIEDNTRARRTIMISSDDVLITVNPGINVGATNQQNQLSTSAHPFPFKFSAFGTDFQIDYDVEGTARNAGRIARNPNGGEKWELV